MKVSIIIGLYNVSRFLKRDNLKCILEQSYQDLEIILIDDGSTDETYKECLRLKSIDNRILVLKKENGGLGSARNKGLDTATGKYVWFYDVDDTVDLHLVEENVKHLESTNADMSVFGFQVHDLKLRKIEKVELTHQNLIFNSNNELKENYKKFFIDIKYGNGFNWNKVYRRSFIEKNSFRFGNQRIQQDEIFNIKLYEKLTKIVILKNCFYFYYIYSSGNTRSKYISNRMSIYTDIYLNLKFFYEGWYGEDKEIKYLIERRLFNGLLVTLEKNIIHKENPNTHNYNIKEINKIVDNAIISSNLSYISSTASLTIKEKLYIKLIKQRKIMALYCTLIVVEKIKKLNGKV